MMPMTMMSDDANGGGENQVNHDEYAPLLCGKLNYGRCKVLDSSGAATAMK